jgi:hypothetical protein
MRLAPLQVHCPATMGSGSLFKAIGGTDLSGRQEPLRFRGQAQHRTAASALAAAAPDKERAARSMWPGESPRLDQADVGTGNDEALLAAELAMQEAEADLTVDDLLALRYGWIALCCLAAVILALLISLACTSHCKLVALAIFAHRVSDQTPAG